MKNSENHVFFFPKKNIAKNVHISSNSSNNNRYNNSYNSAITLLEEFELKEKEFVLEKEKIQKHRDRRTTKSNQMLCR
jgi:ABC-type polar amino acid transport system ATPase subunit